MTITEIVDVILATPEVAMMSRSYNSDGTAVTLLTVEEKKKAIENYIPVVVNDITIRHDWDFVIGTDTEATVADTSEYALEGADQDARKIKEVKFDDGSSSEPKPLIFKSFSEAGEFFYRNADVSESSYWTPIGFDANGFPKIKVRGTPTTGGDTLSYTYWRRLQFGQMPEEFHSAVIEGVKAKINSRFIQSYEFMIDILAREYESLEDGDNVARLDDHLRNRNIKRNNMFGW